MVLAGAYLAYLRLPQASDLWNEHYGRVLLLKSGLVVLGGYAPLVLGTAVVADDWVGGGLPWLWAVFCVVFMGGRFLMLTRRAAGERWIVTGAGG